MTEVTIIIPNYNGKHFLKPCLDSIKKQSYKDFVTIVIDNGSTDGSREIVEQEYPWVKLVKREKNYGFCNAVKRGIHLSKTPYVLLLNNDTEADKDFVKELYAMIKQDKRIFSVSSKMLNYKERELLDDAGDMYCVLGWPFQRGVGRKASYYKNAAPVFSSCAGAAIYRCSIFEEIGYFDENHFAYLEDMDIGYRARKYGYLNYFCPTAEVYHVGSGTSGSKYNEFKVRHSSRNSVYLNYKNMPAWQLILNFPALLAGYFIKWLFFVKIGFGKTYVKGIVEGFCTLGKVKKVPFQKGHIKNDICLEIELIRNMFIYLYEFGKRKIES